MIKRHLWDKVLCPRGLCDLYCNFGRRVVRSVFRWRRGLDFCDTKTCKVRHLQAGHDRSCQNPAACWPPLRFSGLWVPVSKNKLVALSNLVIDSEWFWSWKDEHQTFGVLKRKRNSVGSCQDLEKRKCRHNSWWEAPKDEVGYQPKFKF